MQSRTAEKVAAQLRAELARRQIARNDFAEQLGVHPIWLSRRLNGTVEISLGDAERMAEALDLKVEDLLCPAPVVGGAS